MDKLVQNTETEFKKMSEKLETAQSTQSQEIQKSFLNDLISIREALFTDLTNLSKKGGDIQCEAGPKGDLAEENKALREENARLNYRIDILTKGFRNLLEKNEFKELQKENEKLQYNVNHLRNVVREKVTNTQN